MYFMFGLSFLLILGLAGLIYLYKRIRKYKFIKEHKILGRITAAFAPLGISVLITKLLGISSFNIIIILLHLIVFWALCDLLGFIMIKCQKKKKKRSKRYIAGSAAIAITLLYLGAGWFFAHYIFETDYSLTTDKYMGKGLRIVQLTDSHLGVTVDGDKFAKELEKIRRSKPDILVLTGDFVDDDTAKEDMIKACEALGDFEATYGKFFVWGNHDKGYFGNRDFTADEMVSLLEKNNVTVLEDESVFIDSRFYIVGRKDRSDPNRLEISELTKDLDRSKYMIILDHQPDDYENEVKAEVDLVLSGHTHGGHIFPAGLVGKIAGTDDQCYGLEKRNKTDFIVSSGISAWAIPFKTFAISEYVIIDIMQNESF